jgi:hypothetical protein
MFSGEFKEKDQTEVELPEKSCQDVSEMIRFIHPGFVSLASFHNLFEFAHFSTHIFNNLCK